MRKVSEIKVSYTTNIVDKIKVSSSEDVYKLTKLHWDLDIIEFQEEVKLLLLNRAHTVLGIYELSKGGTSSSVVDIKVILGIALKSNAHAIILLHNHPSGNLQPSEVDKKITNKLKGACKLVDLVLLDHLIISKNNYYSFSVNGLL